MLAKERDELRYRLASERDPLTNLANRRTFVTQANQVLQQEEGGASLLLLDIDHFKAVNDTYGHAAGDQVLLAFSRAIEQRMPKGWLFARIGGEEFAILFQDADFGEVVAMTERLRRSIANRLIDAFHQTIAVTVSGGLADITPMRDFSAVYAAADRALYAAKTSGRNRIVLERDMSRSPQADTPSLTLTDAAISAA